MRCLVLCFVFLVLSSCAGSTPNCRVCPDALHLRETFGLYTYPIRYECPKDRTVEFRLKLSGEYKDVLSEFHYETRGSARAMKHVSMDPATEMVVRGSLSEGYALLSFQSLDWLGENFQGKARLQLSTSSILIIPQKHLGGEWSTVWAILPHPDFGKPGRSWGTYKVKSILSGEEVTLFEFYNGLDKNEDNVVLRLTARLVSCDSNPLREMEKHASEVLMK